MALEFFKKRAFFSAEEIEEINYAMRFTPDVARLSAFKSWWLFVYSNEQDQHPHALKDVEYQKQVVFTSGTYSLWTKQLGAESFAIALNDCTHEETERLPILTKTKMSFVSHTKKVARPERIKGQLVKVTPKTLFRLDAEHRNGIEFKRNRISLIIPFRFQYLDKEKKLHVSDQYTQLVIAWAYIGVQDYWDKQIDGEIEEKEDGVVRVKRTGVFKPAKLFEPADALWNKFYEFNTLAYDD